MQDKENNMKLVELLQVTDELETTINVYADGKKVKIDPMRDNHYEVLRIYGGGLHEMNVEIDAKEWRQDHPDFE